MEETPTTPTETPSPAPAAAPMMDSGAGQKKNTGLIIGIIVAALLIVAGAIVCVILLTSNNGKDGGGSENANNTTPTNQVKPNGTGGGGGSEKDISKITCLAEGDTWEYGKDVTVDNKNLKVTKLKISLKTTDDYVADDLTDNEKYLLAGGALQISSFATKNDPGVKISTISEGDSTGAGVNMSVEITRSKAEDEEVLSVFDEGDGYTAEEIVEMIEADNLDDLKMFCEIN